MRNPLVSRLFLPALLLLGLASAGAFEVIRLDDGTVLRGKVVRQNDSIVEIESENMGLVKVKRKHIVSSPVKDSELGSARRLNRLDLDPIGHTLLLLPTAFTPPKGSLVFRDFELLFLTLGYSPTASTSVVAGAMFPVSTQFNAATLGVKQQLYLSGDRATAFAVTGNVTMPFGSEINDAGFLWLANGVVSHRFLRGFGVHAAAGGVGAQGRGESVQSLSLGAGADLRVHDNAKLIAEYLRGGTSFDPGGSLSLLNFGIRLHGERLSADIAAVKPLEGEIEGLWLYPLVTIGYRF
jgi:hypothetical protein